MIGKAKNITDNQEAKLKYSDGEFDVLVDGQYVVCAVTGNKISVSDLKYWSVERQEPYESAEAALAGYKENSRLVHGFLRNISHQIIWLIYFNGDIQNIY